MVDLHRQYLKIKSEIDLAVNGVINSGVFVKGEEVKSFEKELADYLNVKHIVACANGTDALQICLMALELKPGDEVITPDFTFISTVEVAALLGLKPVLTDVEPGTFNMDIGSLRKAITPRTRAIIPVHLFGQCANMDEILTIAGEKGIIVIEDTAQALSAEYILSTGVRKKAGTMGLMGTTSFFPSKNLGCFGDGGAIFTNDDLLAEKLAAITHHGMRKRYYYDTVGVNSRLDTIQAAILRVKLKHLDTYSASREKAAAFYDNAFRQLTGVKIPFRSAFSTHVFHQYTLTLNEPDRDALMNFLQLKGIPSMIYYPFPLHLQKAFKHLNYKAGDFPASEYLCKSVLSLPMHTELTEEELAYISQSVLEYFTQK